MAENPIIIDTTQFAHSLDHHFCDSLIAPLTLLLADYFES
jgi:hypothetical protein